MKTCPYCGHQNPRRRILCEQCSKRIDKENTLLRIASGLMMIIGGIALIAADSTYDLAICHLIPIPFVLSILGVLAILVGIGRMSGSDRASKKRSDAEDALSFSDISERKDKQQSANSDNLQLCPHCNHTCPF